MYIHIPTNERNFRELKWEMPFPDNDDTERP